MEVDPFKFKNIHHFWRFKEAGIRLTQNDEVMRILIVFGVAAESAGSCNRDEAIAAARRKPLVIIF